MYTARSRILPYTLQVLFCAAGADRARSSMAHTCRVPIGQSWYAACCFGAGVARQDPMICSRLPSSGDGEYWWSAAPAEAMSIVLPRLSIACVSNRCNFTSRYNLRQG